jgi:hypothetical protein
MVEPTPSRRTHESNIDSEQFYRLISIAEEIGVYSERHEARTDNYEAILDVVCTFFEENHLENIDD